MLELVHGLLHEVGVRLVRVRLDLSEQVHQHHSRAGRHPDEPRKPMLLALLELSPRNEFDIPPGYLG
jgi:hypothetical protein